MGKKIWMLLIRLYLLYAKYIIWLVFVFPPLLCFLQLSLQIACLATPLLFLYAAYNETFPKMKSYSICLCLFLVVSVTFIQFIKIHLFPCWGGSTGHEGLAEFSILHNITVIALWRIFVAVTEFLGNLPANIHKLRIWRG